MKEEPKKHHYVPEVYLRYFSLSISSGDIYKLIKKRNNLNPKLVNVSQICYEKFYYKIKRKETLDIIGTDDALRPEREFFGYENTELKKYFDKLISKESLFLSEYTQLLAILLHIKRRNPVYKKGYDDESVITEVFNETIKNLCNSFDGEIDGYNITKEQFEKSLSKYKELEKNKDYMHDMFVSNLDFNKSTEPIKEILEDLKKWKATIFYTDSSLPFITSDNPGYTIKGFNEIYNLDLSHIDIFVFPISNIYCMFLERGIFLDGTIFKRIEYRKINPVQLMSINFGSYVNANEIVLASSADQLINTKNLLNFLK